VWWHNRRRLPPAEGEPPAAEIDSLDALLGPIE